MWIVVGLLKALNVRFGKTCFPELDDPSSDPCPLPIRRRVFMAGVAVCLAEAWPGGFTALLGACHDLYRVREYLTIMFREPDL